MTVSTTKVGDTLTAIVTGADVVTYSWTADGEVVGDEEDLEITSDMLGKKIKVKVTNLAGETVTSEESDPVVYETPDIVTAVQKSANSFTLTFDSEADEIVKADDIEVISEDLTDVKKITGLDFSLDGTTAVVTVNTAFKDGVTYNVIYDDSDAFFVASVGEVDKIEITTREAEVNTPTKIDFALFDENGIDITSDVKVDETCAVTFEGDYDNYNNNKASDSTVTMTTINSFCAVSVEYNDNIVEHYPVKATDIIVCVEASEKMGVPFFKTAPDDFNATDGCYRFYDPANSTDTNVIVALDDTELVHFYAQDSDGSAIDYDSYEIESADETVATAEIDQATGKWASFTVTGNTKGNVHLTLKATKNGAESEYNIPVTVTEQSAPVKAKLEVDLPSMSNAWDEEYFGSITVTVYAADGTEADDALYSIDTPEIVTKNIGVDKDLKGDPLYDPATKPTGFRIIDLDHDGDYEYTAYAAEARSYAIKVTVSDLTSGKTFQATNTVNVKELPEVAWRRSTSEPDLVYAPIPWDYAPFTNNAANKAFWSTLTWITVGEFEELPADSLGVGDAIADEDYITLKDGLKLADSNAIAAVDAAAGKGTAKVGDIVYYTVDHGAVTNSTVLPEVFWRLKVPQTPCRLSFWEFFTHTYRQPSIFEGRRYNIWDGERREEGICCRLTDSRDGGEGPSDPVDIRWRI